MEHDFEEDLKETEGSSEDNFRDRDSRDFFLGLKQEYKIQRQTLEYDWDQALSAYYSIDNLDIIYEGRANIRIPIMNWKVNGIVSRINHILFGIEPIGRYEDKKIGENPSTTDVVGLWNKFVFEHQLNEIGFNQAFKEFVKNKTIQGTAVAKISQEFLTKEISFFEGDDPEEVVIRDNTFFRNMLLKEFYSDINKQNINDSQACIHSTTITLEELMADRKREEIETFEILDPDTNEVVGLQEEKKEVGVYKNLNLLQISDTGNVTSEQIEYMQTLDLNSKEATIFEKSLKEVKRTGSVQIDECYGIFSLKEGERAQEVVCTIANGTVVIRLEPTPFKHKRFVRPFIVGRYQTVPNNLYGSSNVIIGLNLLQELNAARAQAMDARTRSVSPMVYVDATRRLKWDGQWRPNGKIVGNGTGGIEFLLNPFLGGITTLDTTSIEKDLSQLWSLSPVQEGTTDPRLIPSTKGGTLAVINQNDLPINDIINHTINHELKPFLEMLFERNLVFKSVDDLRDVWTDKEIQQVFARDDIQMKDLNFDAAVKILGNLELSNEIAHQQGYEKFIAFATSIPPLAKRLDWQVLGDKMLRSYGIKDDSDDQIWLDEELVLRTEQAQQQQRQQAQQQSIQLGRAEKTFESDLKIKENTAKERAETEGNIIQKQVEGVVETAFGVKVN